MENAKPTLTHKAMAHLIHDDTIDVKQIVTQNVDNLHRLAAILHYGGEDEANRTVYVFKIEKYENVE